MDLGLLNPLERGGGRHVMVDVYETLQALILNGQLEPGTILSQVVVARMLKVSRTPVREAMRKLQEGGLVTAEPNLRSRVLAFDPSDIETLYMKRIVLEAMAVTLTVKSMAPRLLSDLVGIANALEGEEARACYATWQRLHHQFHRQIVLLAGDVYIAELDALEKKSERYHLAYRGAHPDNWWRRGEKEHRALVEAFQAGDAPRAGELAARHLARTALALLAALAPDYDTTRVRMALRYASAGAGLSTKTRRWRPAEPTTSRVTPSVVA